jgi:hypothetical protein
MDTSNCQQSSNGVFLRSPPIPPLALEGWKWAFCPSLPTPGLRSPVRWKSLEVGWKNRGRCSVEKRETRHTRHLCKTPSVRSRAQSLRCPTCSLTWIGGNHALVMAWQWH